MAAHDRDELLSADGGTICRQRLLKGAGLALAIVALGGFSAPALSAQPTFDLPALAPATQPHPLPLAESLAQQGPAAPCATQVDHETRSIPRWDGKGGYLAQWTAIDNEIDDSSVCANQRPGSIDHRECRKGAKVYFRNQCKKLASDRTLHGQRLKARYCHAAESFSPM